MIIEASWGEFGVRFCDQPVGHSVGQSDVGRNRMKMTWARNLTKDGITRHQLRIPWLLFTVGIVTVPLVFVTASKLSDPAWDWDTSIFGRTFAMPLLVISLCLCASAPFLRRPSNGGRLGLSLLAMVVFGFVLVVTSIVCAFVFGTAIR